MRITSGFAAVVALGLLGVAWSLNAGVVEIAKPDKILLHI